MRGNEIASKGRRTDELFKLWEQAEKDRRAAWLASKEAKHEYDAALRAEMDAEHELLRSIPCPAESCTAGVGEPCNYYVPEDFGTAYAGRRLDQIPEHGVRRDAVLAPRGRQ